MASIADASPWPTTEATDQNSGLVPAPFQEPTLEQAGINPHRTASLPYQRKFSLPSMPEEHSNSITGTSIGRRFSDGAVITYATDTPATSMNVSPMTHVPMLHFDYTSSSSRAELLASASRPRASQHVQSVDPPRRAGPTSKASDRDKPYKCDHCPLAFNRNHDLRRHKILHLPVKPFACPVCQKQFARKDAIKRHFVVKPCAKELTSEQEHVALMGNPDFQEPSIDAPSMGSSSMVSPSVTSDSPESSASPRLNDLPAEMMEPFALPMLKDPELLPVNDTTLMPPPDLPRPSPVNPSMHHVDFFRPQQRVDRADSGDQPPFLISPTDSSYSTSTISSHGSQSMGGRSGMSTPSMVPSMSAVMNHYPFRDVFGSSGNHANNNNSPAWLVSPEVFVENQSGHGLSDYFTAAPPPNKSTSSWQPQPDTSGFRLKSWSDEQPAPLYHTDHTDHHTPRTQ